MSFYEMHISEEDGDMVCLFDVDVQEDDWGRQNTWLDLYKVFIAGCDVTSTITPRQRRSLEARAFKQMKSEAFEDAIAEVSE